MEHHFQQGDNVALYNVQAWGGTDYNKLWLKAEGEYNTSKDRHEETQLEVLYSRNILSYWDKQTDKRHDLINHKGVPPTSLRLRPHHMSVMKATYRPYSKQNMIYCYHKARYCNRVLKPKSPYRMWKNTISAPGLPALK